jgi:hypothetical protein
MIASPMQFDELDAATRQWMEQEFEAEEASGRPYRSKRLSEEGLRLFSGLMRQAIRDGNESSLFANLVDPSFWLARDRGGKTTNVRAAAESLALTEFNTWYVRGFARRLMEEGEEECQIYRAGIPLGTANPECTQHEGRVYAVTDIYAGHRARYWPEPGNRTALSIPLGPSCHHTVRRVR